MIRIGLTGGVASGKSEVLSILRELGCHTISADDINHELMRTNKQLIANLKKTFNCVDENGVVNRKLLGKLVFKDEKAKLKLESFIHPLVKLVRKEFFKKVEGVGGKFAVCETPLLFERNLLPEFDFSVVITAPLDKRIERFVKRGSGDEAKFWSISKNQMLDSKKIEKADFVVKNNGNKIDLKKQLEKILNEMTIRKKESLK